jgi:hypothetical protein
LNFYGLGSDQKNSILDTNNFNKSSEEKIKDLISKLNLNTDPVEKDLFGYRFDDLTLDIDFPKISEFLPHLNGKTHLIQPKFKLTKNRFASIVIGIPTIRREKTSYLLQTIKSLLDAMNELEKSEALIVVMIAEVIYWIF